MGKKGSWFAAIKRVFIPTSKEKQVNGSDKNSTKEKKKGKGILRDGETKSFIPLFREPSSIEKILGEADQQKIVISPPHTPTADQPKTPPLVVDGVASPRATSPKDASPRATSPKDASPRVTSPKASSPRVTSSKASSPRATSPQVASPRVVSPGPGSSKAVHHRQEVSYKPEPTLGYQHLSAIKIQAAYRGYMARRSFIALRGLVRLQGAVKGQNVKRQTINAMKMMQLLVRVQTQIQSRRIQMLENQALRRRQAYKNDKELESSLGKCTVSQSEEGLQEEWDDSLLTKEEIEARMHRKVEAIVKRERVMAYAYSHQLWKGNPKSAAKTWAMDIRTGGYPWWWNWLERQLPPANPSHSETMKSFLLTPPRPTTLTTSEPKPSPQPANGSSKKHKITSGLDNLEALTPKSTRSAVPVRTKDLHTPSNRTPTNNSIIMNKSLKPRSSVAVDSGFDVPLKDDDSLMSCPPFSVPNYMTQTVSAKAKVRINSNPNDSFPGTPSSGDFKSKRRFSFPITSNIGSFKWNKGSTKDSTSQRALEKQSTGDLSIDSTVSMPAAVGRKPFNRFV